ncbi:uncharacterized protein BCR38DRAFT_324275, partial [Pseudomassariella vexata]
QWSTCWEQKRTPWDRGGPSVALSDLLAQRSEPSGYPSEDTMGRKKQQTVLVPGCERGHDVL